MKRDLSRRLLSVIAAVVVLGIFAGLRLNVVLVIIAALAAAIAIVETIRLVANAPVPRRTPELSIVFVFVLTALFVRSMSYLLHSGFGNWWFALLVVGTWGGDIVGYLMGRREHHHAISVRVNPLKTWETSAFIALVATATIASIAIVALEIHWKHAIVVALGTTIFAQAGDLLESAFKRRCGVKHSGRAGLGHGGMLDVLDGMLLAAPWLAFCLLWLP